MMLPSNVPARRVAGDHDPARVYAFAYRLRRARRNSRRKRRAPRRQAAAPEKPLACPPGRQLLHARTRFSCLAARVGWAGVGDGTTGEAMDPPRARRPRLRRRGLLQGRGEDRLHDLRIARRPRRRDRGRGPRSEEGEGIVRRLPGQTCNFLETGGCRRQVRARDRLQRRRQDLRLGFALRGGGSVDGGSRTGPRAPRRPGTCKATARAPRASWNAAFVRSSAGGTNTPFASALIASIAAATTADRVRSQTTSAPVRAVR
jgi:hypothetical protein